MPALPIPLAISQGRRALAEMFIDLSLAFCATTVEVGAPPPETDVNLALVGVAVMLGHANGHPMNASQIATRLNMPRTTVMRRLDTLVAHGLLTRIEDRYYLELKRARDAPLRDRFTLILLKGFAVLGPILSKTDT